ncbi:MAG: hypothetical protein A3B10_02665 [Candidatus Doudnabacteria bacterium RIFCSPLOWO2_01_FULL_44_21]|uniref:DUF86 domain-containing protein n=1 Tax=Candidatus Doudnabacteria bacterium RIFCSPLOWO2_01_FULL_44_21 TaxID=1817841 RepID=A0A1F5Q1X7_9BACT|nr:MAG: hypothetical protein A3B95_02935 [Candidatus Doudnabacteria bacterium RIFCSPHIGHO2_02_FULL_43_13b]OGE96191.1 MAG: hypothetical protein A3B10_02665 [Candidatus Doudnabacteria bacterium RIFCSPLOWO2_01_FULL_44_21]
MDKDKIYIAQIKEFCSKIIEFTSKVSFEHFVANEQLHLAIVKLIENIGEAAKRTSQATKDTYPHVDWKRAMAMRDRLVHDYMDVDLEIVFDVATTEVPRLLKNL